MPRNKSSLPSGSVPADEHGGNFGVGLFVGVVAGSLGMFLFGTKQGQELLQNIKRELEESSDSHDLPGRAQKLIASVRDSVEGQMESYSKDQFETSENVDEFPKFKRRLAE